jgi:hypothetical protein
MYTVYICPFRWPRHALPRQEASLSSTHLRLANWSPVSLPSSLIKPFRSKPQSSSNSYSHISLPRASTHCPQHFKHARHQAAANFPQITVFNTSSTQEIRKQPRISLYLLSKVFNTPSMQNVVLCSVRNSE